MRRREPPTRAAHRPTTENLAPALVVTIELEQPARARIAAATYEDELRLRSWLRRSEVVASVPGLVRRMLDDWDTAA
jgi:hypothetical protein